MKEEQGLTLIELICTITVLGMLLVVAVPSITDLIDKWVLESTAREIVEDIRWTQYLAITKGVTHNFDLNVANRSYRVRSALLQEPTIKSVKFKSTITNITSTFRNHGSYKRLSFATTGNPSQTGSIILTSKKGREITITVAVGTGRVIIKY